MQGTTKEKILTVLSGGTTIGLIPFVLVRISRGEWAIAILDAVLVALFAGLFLFVRLTHKTLLASIVLAIAALFGNVISNYLNGPDQIYWVYPAMIVVFYLLPARLAITLNTLAFLLAIPAYWGRIDTVTTFIILVTLILTNIFAYIFASQAKKQQEAMRRLSIQDSLTGIGNRRALMEALTAHKNGRKKARQGTTCLILMDLDHFKQINDSYGHLTGDEVLKQFSRLLNRAAGENGQVFRYGGEEFVVVVECPTATDCWKLAEKIRNDTELNQFVNDIRLTVSLGIAEIDDDEDLDGWLSRADKALYHAKNSGRNQSRLDTGPPAQNAPEASAMNGPTMLA